MEKPHAPPRRPVPGRAETDAEKRVYLDDLLTLWRQHPTLRFGQLLVNAMGPNQGPGPGPGLALIEDAPLLERVRGLGQRAAVVPEPRPTPDGAEVWMGEGDDGEAG